MMTGDSERTAADDLYQIVTLKALSDGLMKKIQKNYRFIVGFNSILIALGVGGVIQPTTSALLHNGSTMKKWISSIVKPIWQMDGYMGKDLQLIIWKQ